MLSLFRAAAGLITRSLRSLGPVLPGLFGLVGAVAVGGIAMKLGRMVSGDIPAPAPA